MFVRVVTSLCSCQQCALAAVIIVNLKGMFIQVTDLKKLWYISKYDFVSIVIPYIENYHFVLNILMQVSVRWASEFSQFQVFRAERGSGLKPFVLRSIHYVVPLVDESVLRYLYVNKMRTIAEWNLWNISQFLWIDRLCDVCNCGCYYSTADLPCYVLDHLFDNNHEFFSLVEDRNNDHAFKYGSPISNCH